MILHRCFAWDRRAAPDQAGSAVAQLARLLRDDQMDRFAAGRLIALLSQRSFPLPEVGPLRHQDNIVYAAYFDVDGLWPTQIDNDQFPKSRELFRNLFSR